MKNLFIVLAFSLITSSAAAQDVPSLLQGRPAPFDGFLIRGSDLAQWKLRIEVLEHQLTLDVTTEQRIAAVQVSLGQARTQAVEARLVLRERLWREQTTLLTNDLAAARKAAARSWYESPTLWFALGLVVTGVFSVALVAL